MHTRPQQDVSEKRPCHLPVGSGGFGKPGDGVAVALRCRRAYCAGIDGEWWFLQGLGGDAEKCPGYG